MADRDVKREISAALGGFGSANPGTATTRLGDPPHGVAWRDDSGVHLARFELPSSGGKGAKMALGALLTLIGAVILTGADKQIEAVLVEWSPGWLTTLTTRF